MFALSRQFVGTSLATLLCVIGVTSLQYPRMNKMLATKQGLSSEALERDVLAEKARLNLLEKIPSFGYDNLLANWMYLSFLQYFGDDEVRAKTGYALSPEYFEIILKHDPRFRLAYLALSTSTSMYAAMPERSVKITEQGLKKLTPWAPLDSYYVWRYKGVDELLFLGNSQAARKSFQSAADWASKHSDEDSKLSASISQGTANFLARNPNSKRAQISAWGMVLQNQIDKETEKRAIRAIEALGGQVVNTPQGNQIKFPQND
ncbi:hypothetical protein DSM106972_015130 [Dulcicalothrix desertica PCC 7102]|uniref:Uncharacterized protein n=1 Tax=Dulcicalothrix desertica PCC 7102 TaxID=232991 RepID=A0A3S1CS52_9CYAN|nr:hypothetical protein [Dulcicalothrix desertica]RUT08345.1 hypothetical protein DSM106972_015130 [Dulcicalothrix desertica PCC 7102]TWH40211.1 hypothetical protein CAL7102_09515 [Dulcicalothrix desertica PCC 7102]